MGRKERTGGSSSSGGLISACTCRAAHQAPPAAIGCAPQPASPVFGYLAGQVTGTDSSRDGQKMSSYAQISAQCGYVLCCSIFPGSANGSYQWGPITSAAHPLRPCQQMSAACIPPDSPRPLLLCRHSAGETRMPSPPWRGVSERNRTAVVGQ